MAIPKRDHRFAIPFKSPLTAILIASSIAAAYVHALGAITAVRVASPKYEDYAFQYEDYAFRLRHNYYSTVASSRLKPKDIVLVTIDEESYKRLEKKWPWGRDVFADFLDKLCLYGPKTIALDFALYGESPDNPQADAKLARAIKRCGNVIVGSVYGREKLYLGPYDIFAKASAGYGVIGVLRDKDNAIRRLTTFALVFAPQKGGDIPFEIKAAAHYLDVPYDTIDTKRGSVVLRSENKRVEIPTDENGYLWINYLSDRDDIETVPIWKVMEGSAPRDMFRNKLVLVSQTGEIFHDLHSTPFGLRSGGVIIANTLNSIVSGIYLKKASFYATVPLTALIYTCAFVLFYRSPVSKDFFIFIALAAALSAISFMLFLNGTMWPTFHTIALLTFLFLGIVFYKYAVMALESAEVKRMTITDSMTLLYTHRYFRFLLEQKVKEAASLKQKASLILIKLLSMDRIIKDISFNKGQAVQKKVAEQIRLKLPRNTAGAYLGMGEFGMLLPEIGIDEALGIAGSLRDNVRDMDFGISEKLLKPAVAIGVSTLNDAAFPKTGKELMRTARAAMARAREIGLDKVCKFNPKIDSSVFEPDAMEKEIRQRLDDEFGFIAIDLEERNKELEDLLRQLSVAQRDLEQAHFETLRSLITALEEKDPCSSGHSERVGELAEKIARKLKMPEEEVTLLKQAAVLHDIGKTGIPQDILRKEEGLNASERHIIELHPEFSVRILNTSKYFRNILGAIRDHHERLDGTGYPRGLKAEQICLEAQIIAITDVFDAMSTDRPYRKALSAKMAIDEILAHPEKYNHKIALILKKVIQEEGGLS